MTFIGNIILSLLVLLSSILIHELGHWTYAKIILKKHMKISISLKECVIGELKDYTSMGRGQRIMLYSSGIIFGMIPILLLLSSIYKFIVLIVYLYGCKHDIKCIIGELSD